MHAWIFLCLFCGTKFIKQLNDILHKEFDEVLMHHEQITKCPNCNYLCASVEYDETQIIDELADEEVGEDAAEF